MNKVHLVGRLGKEPELRYTNGKGVAYCFFNLAVDGGYDKKKQEKRTDWIPIAVWGRLAESCAKGLIKGSMVAVMGRVSTGSYEKDGVKQFKVDITAEEIDFLTRPKKVEVE